MKNLKIFAILAVFIAIFVGCGGNSRHHMTLNDENGFDTTFDSQTKALKISGWEGPYILFFFSTMCAACDEQVPVMNEILGDFGQNVRVYGIMGDTMGFDGDIFTLNKKGVKFPSTSTPKSVSYLSNIVGGVMGTPVSYIFDKDGKMKKQFLGLYPKSAFENELKLLLN